MTQPSNQPDPDCIFCKIVVGDIPAIKVLETPHALAFLDVAPLADGHTLLIPKRHYATLPQMPANELALVLQPLPALAESILSVVGAEAFNVLQNNGRAAGQAVDHVHFHIIPRVADDGLGYRWNAGAYPQERAEELGRKIKAALDE